MTQLATTNTPKGALAIMAERVNIDPKKLHETLKNTVFKGANDHELVALVLVANEYKLNPLVKQIYAFPAKGGGVVPVVGIDGWLKIINDHPQYDGMETLDIIDDGKIVAVECKIHRKDRSHPTVIREYLSECRRKTEPWETMPQRMLRHKAIMQCARVAFGIGGITDEDEAKERTAYGTVVESTGTGELTSGLTKPNEEPKREPETLTLDATPETPMEHLGRIANDKDVPIATLFVEAGMAGIVKEKQLDDYSEKEIYAVIESFKKS
jgi:phage recombination protein Bet